MRLGTTLTIFSLRKNSNSPDAALEGIAACKEAGFDVVDLYFNEVIKLSPLQQDAWAERAAALLKEHNIPAAQAHAHFGGVCSHEGDEEEAYQQRVIRTIELADRLHIPWIVVHPIDYAETLHDDKIDNDVQNALFFRRVLRELPASTIGLAFENMSISHYRTADRLLALRHAADDHERFGFCWDTGHANLALGADQPAHILQLGKLIKCTHIQDNLGEKDNHYMPMMGIIDWPQVVHALKESGYAGDFVYESAQPLKHMPEDNVMRMEFMRYTVKLGRYLLSLE